MICHMCILLLYYLSIYLSIYLVYYYFYLIIIIFFFTPGEEGQKTPGHALLLLLSCENISVVKVQTDR